MHARRKKAFCRFLSCWSSRYTSRQNIPLWFTGFTIDDAHYPQCTSPWASHREHTTQHCDSVWGLGTRLVRQRYCQQKEPLKFSGQQENMGSTVPSREHWSHRTGKIPDRGADTRTLRRTSIEAWPSWCHINDATIIMANKELTKRTGIALLIWFVPYTWLKVDPGPKLSPYYHIAWTIGPIRMEKLRVTEVQGFIICHKQCFPLIQKLKT